MIKFNNLKEVAETTQAKAKDFDVRLYALVETSLLTGCSFEQFETVAITLHNYKSDSAKRYWNKKLKAYKEVADLTSKVLKAKPAKV